jgi:natural product precursor
MKKLNIKLSLNKETIAVLNKAEMSSVKGGFTWSLSTGDRFRSEGGCQTYCCGRGIF